MELGIALATLLISIVTALFVFQKNPRSATNVYFALLVFFISVYPIFNYLAVNSTTNESALIWAKMILFVSIPQGPLLYFFAKTFPSTNFIFNKRRQIFITIWLLANILLAFLGLIFKEVSVHDKVVSIQPGPLVPSFGVLHASTILAGLVVLFRKYKKSTSSNRHQLEYVFYGILVSFSLTFLITFVLPILLKNTFLLAISPIFLAVSVVAVAYAIVKHSLFDIRLIVARSVAYVLSLGLLAAIYASVTSWLANRVFAGLSNDTILLVINTSGFLVAVLIYPYIKRFFDKITNKLFYRDAYDAQAFLDQFNKVLVGNVELEKLLEQSSKVIADNLKAEFCLFWVGQTSYLPRRTISASRHRINSETVEKIRSLISHSRRNVIVTDELQGESELHKQLNRDGIAVLTQIAAKSKDDGVSMGYMVLGQKKSGNVYNNQDIKLISIIANELVIATQNALRFEEIEHFNVTLQEKVDDATKQLRHTNERLKLLDETKDDFISMASHQLRTPLTSVKGYLSMVLEGDAGKLNDKEKKLLNQAFISSQRMVYLISDLLNVSRLRTGKFVIEPSQVNLAEVIQGEVEQLIETAGSRNLTLSYQKPKQFPTLMLDETKIRQVAMNFMDNAVHYTPSGGHINVILEDKGATIEFRVEDDGLGVPRHQQHHLFSKFFRADNAKKARPDGTGLGLFMAKKVIIAQGGSIIFKSQEGKGSTFGFTFAKAPLQPPAATQTHPK